MIRVVIADDFPQMITVMKKLIAHSEGMVVANVLTTFDEVLERIREIEHDVVLMNDYLPPMTSVKATARLREMGMNEPVLVISMRKDADFIRESLDAGANGFVLKKEFKEHLIPAIRAVYGGDRYLSPLARDIVENPEEV